jgi:hypothetical protein
LLLPLQNLSIFRLLEGFIPSLILTDISLIRLRKRPFFLESGRDHTTLKEAGEGRDNCHRARGRQQQPNATVTYEIPEESVLSGSWGLAAIYGQLMFFSAPI